MSENNAFDPRLCPCLFDPTFSYNPVIFYLRLFRVHLRTEFQKEHDS